MEIIKNIVDKVMIIIRPRLRNLYNQKNQKRLKNHDFSVVSVNCIGACILHDLGQRFNSPFVNLWMKPKDFLKFAENMDHYLNFKMSFQENSGYDYPVGILDDIKIYFQHYSSQSEVLEKWYNRSRRMKWNNLFFVFCDREGCSYQELVRFNELPYKNKVAFTHLPYPELESCFYIKGWEKEESVGMCMDYKSWISYHKYYDDFDYVAWFNQGNSVKTAE